MPIDKPTETERAKWEKILLGFNLGMMNGVGQLYYREIYPQEKPTDYVRTHRTKEQHLKTLNGYQWKDPAFKAKRSEEASEQMKKKWAENPHWRKPTSKPEACTMKGKHHSAATRKKISNALKGRAVKTPMVNLCGHLEKPHYAKGKCRACWTRAWREQKNSRPVAPRLDVDKNDLLPL